MQCRAFIQVVCLAVLSDCSSFTFPRLTGLLQWGNISTAPHLFTLKQIIVLEGVLRSDDDMILLLVLLTYFA